MYSQFIQYGRIFCMFRVGGKDREIYGDGVGDVEWKRKAYGASS